MSYHTICVIVFNKNISSAPRSNEYIPEKEFLVLNNEGKYKFWSYIDNSIGARYQRDILDRKFYEEFNIKLGLDSVKIISQTRKRGENKPASTVLIVELDEESYNYIKQSNNTSYNWIDSTKLSNESNSNWIENQKWIHDLKPEEYDELKRFNLDLLARVRQLQNANTRGNLVIFVGAGISKASNVPLWKELTEELKKDIGDLTDDFELVPQFYFQIHKDVNYFEKIENILKTQSVNRNSIHREIFKINPNHVITTNYDTLLEEEANSQGNNYYIVKKDDDLPYSNSHRLIIKMHGDISTRNIVLKEDDYLRYQQEFPLIENYIKSIFSSKQILFIGFSFNDRNLKKIIESVRVILKEDYRPAILFKPDLHSTLDTNWVNYYKSRGVNVIGYEKRIKKYLIEIGRFKKIFSKDFDTKVSFKKKTRILNFLRFLRLYSDDDFMYFEKNPNIVDIMYNSLKTYSDIPVIPFKIIEKIKPFAKFDNKPATYDHVGYHLEVESPEILKLLSNIDRIEDKAIVYKDESIELNTKLNEKLVYIYNKFRKSAVFCIQRKHDYKDEIHNKLRLINNEEKEECECPTCLLSAFKLDRAYIESERQSINEESKFYYIKIAYAQFYFANYEGAYINLRKCASLCQRSKDYHLYFICLYNIKQLNYRVKGLEVPDDIDEDSKKDILDEIETISLPSLIEELYISKLSKELLRLINTQDIYNYTKRNITLTLSNIKKLFASHKSGATQFAGPNYIVKTIYYYRVYLNYIENNFLFNFYYSEHEEITEQFAEAIIYSFASDSSLRQKLNKVQLYDIIAIIKYCKPKKLDDLISELLDSSIYDLTLYENDIDKFLDLFYNYLNSHLTEFTFLKTEVKIKNSIRYIKDDKFIVNQRINQLLDNFVIITSKIYPQLKSNSKLKIVENKLFDYLIGSEYFPFRILNSFNRFISSYISNNEENNYNYLLSSLLKNRKWSKEYLNTFIAGIHKVNPNFSFNEDLWKSIVTIVRDDNRRFDLYDIISINNFLSEHQKSELLDILNSQEISIHKLPLLYNNGVIRKMDIENMSASFQEMCSKDPRIVTFGKYRSLSDPYFFRFYKLYILGVISLDKEFLEDLRGRNNLYTFLIIPLEFNYENFDSEWLKVLCSDTAWSYVAKENSNLKVIISEILVENFEDNLNMIFWKYFAE